MFLMKRHMKCPKMRDGTSKELTHFVNNLIELVQEPSVSARHWETVSSPDYSDNSSLNNNLHTRSKNGDHQHSTGGPQNKSARISTKTAVNIVALAIAR